MTWKQKLKAQYYIINSLSLPLLFACFKNHYQIFQVNLIHYISTFSVIVTEHGLQ